MSEGYLLVVALLELLLVHVQLELHRAGFTDVAVVLDALVVKGEAVLGDVDVEVGIDLGMLKELKELRLGEEILEDDKVRSKETKRETMERDQRGRDKGLGQSIGTKFGSVVRVRQVAQQEQR